MIHPAVLVGHPVGLRLSDYDEQVSARQIPRLDFLELARALNADLIAQPFASTAWQKAVAWTGRKTRLDWASAAFTSRRLSQYSAFLSLSERVAIPLSLAQSLTSAQIPHTVIAHKLSTGRKAHLFRIGRFLRYFSNIICVSQSQVRHAITRLGLPKSNVHFVYDKIDQRFYDPSVDSVESSGNGYILAVGKEQRDYQTLLRAVKGSNLSLIVVASSPWSSSQVEMQDLQNVSVLSNIPYAQLRDLYAGARLVVVPLLDVDYAAGANGLVEAMAMARPIIITRTHGLADYVVHNESAHLVEAGNVAELRDALQTLWHNPSASERLGANARQAVIERMTFERYIDQVCQITTQAALVS